jgi:hypothetical protein
VLNTDATEMCFFLIIAKSVGYISLSVKFFNHLSSQNLTFYPFPNWNWPRLRKESFTFIKPLQAKIKKGILHLHQATPEMGIPLLSTHLSYGTIPHIFSSPQFLLYPILINKLEQPFAKQTPILYIYVLNTQPSLISWLADYAHFANRYFFLCSSLCQ